MDDGSTVDAFVGDAFDFEDTEDFLEMDDFEAISFGGMTTIDDAFVKIEGIFVVAIASSSLLFGFSVDSVVVVPGIIVAELEVVLLFVFDAVEAVDGATDDDLRMIEGTISDCFLDTVGFTSSFRNIERFG